MVQYSRSVKTSTPIQQTWPIIGHAELGRHLVASLANDRFPRATLFCGPRAVGKATGALWLVAAQLCQGSANRPCGTCPSCRQLAAHQHPDVQLIDPEGQEAISIDDVRLALATYQTVSWGKSERWLIILNAERLTESAGNTLLKFLEALPPKMRVLCTTAEPERLLATVRSRLTQYYWHTAPSAAFDLTPAQRRQSLSRLARAAGRPGWYVTLGEAPEALSDDQTRAQEIAEQFATGQFAPISASPSERRQATQQQLEQEELVLRDLLLSNLGSRTRLLWPNLKHPTLPTDRLAKLVDYYLDRHELSTNVQPRILYDDLHMV